MIVPVVLAGGSGTRLWPLSRELSPKQLLALVGRESLLQETLRRVERLEGVGQPIVVCTEGHRFMVAEQVLETGMEAEIVVEPADLDTAPAVALAALSARQRAVDPLLLIMPSDHQIQQVDLFLAAIKAGLPAAEDGCLVIFGITPDRPETGYGYIQPAVAVPTRCSPAGPANPAVPVLRFVEKPDAATAREYIDRGFLWNSGIFLARATVVLEELAQFEPEMSARMQEAHLGRSMERDFIRPAPEPFAAAPARSFDRAVMERTDLAVVVPMACGWRDVGSWHALWESGQPDEEGNILLGRVVNRGSRNCYGRATGRLLALLGVEDLVVVETPDAVLVARRDRVQEVRELVRELKEQGMEEATRHLW